MLDLGFLGCSEFSKDFGCAVLCLSLLIEVDGVSEVALLLVCGTNASIGPEYVSSCILQCLPVTYLAMILKSA